MRPLLTVTFIFFALPSAALASTFHGTISVDAEPSLPAIVMTLPSANPGAGTYTSPQSVTLSADGALNIRYTSDGSPPSCSGDGSGIVFSSPIDVSSSLTIQAVSCYSGNDSPGVVSFAYIIDTSVPAPSGGGGGGNGPVAGSLPLPSNGAGGGGTTNTESVPPANEPTQAPVVASDTTPPPNSGASAGAGTVAGASTTTMPDVQSSNATDTSPQVAAAASSVTGGSDYWWIWLLFLLFLIGDVWWVLNSRKFKKRP